MLNIGNKVENNGATPEGKLTAAEFNGLVSQINVNTSAYESLKKDVVTTSDALAEVKEAVDKVRWVDLYYQWSDPDVKLPSGAEYVDFSSQLKDYTYEQLRELEGIRIWDTNIVGDKTASVLCAKKFYQSDDFSEDTYVGVALDRFIGFDLCGSSICFRTDFWLNELINKDDLDEYIKKGERTGVQSWVLGGSLTSLTFPEDFVTSSQHGDTVVFPLSSGASGVIYAKKANDVYFWLSSEQGISFYRYNKSEGNIILGGFSISQLATTSQLNSLKTTVTDLSGHTSSQYDTQTIDATLLAVRNATHGGGTELASKDDLTAIQKVTLNITGAIPFAGCVAILTVTTGTSLASPTAVYFNTASNRFVARGTSISYYGSWTGYADYGTMDTTGVKPTLSKLFVNTSDNSIWYCDGTTLKELPLNS